MDTKIYRIIYDTKYNGDINYRTNSPDHWYGNGVYFYNDYKTAEEQYYVGCTIIEGTVVFKNLLTLEQDVDANFTNSGSDDRNIITLTSSGMSKLKITTNTINSNKLVGLAEKSGYSSIMITGINTPGNNDQTILITDLATQIKIYDLEEKGFITKAATLLALLPPTSIDNTTMPEVPTPIVRTIDKISLFPTDMLAIIKTESSGGTNVNHKTIKYGLHKGTTAAGYTGLMPLTIRDILRIDKKLKEKYPNILKMTNDQITDYINRHPEVEAKIATSHWNRLGKLFNDKIHKVYAWNQGITAAMRADKEDLLTSPYVLKVASYYKRGDIL